MYDTILVPTDGSDAAEAAVEHAVDLAATYGAELHALYALDVGELPPDFEDDAVHDAFRGRGEKAVEYVGERGREAGVTVVQSIVRGPVTEAILTYLDDNDVDMVVMGTHGWGRLDRLVLGSVTQDVLQEAGVPVVVVREDEAAE